MTASLARTDEWSDVRLSATSSKMAGMYPGNVFQVIDPFNQAGTPIGASQGLAPAGSGSLP